MLFKRCIKIVFGFIIFFLMYNVSLFATAQEQDIIIYNGVEYRITENPMELYFDKYPKRRPSSGGSTSLYRGYIATFEIINNELWVTKIETYGVGYNAMKLEDVTKKCLGGKNKLKANWYSGSLFLPQGNLLSYDRYLLYEYIYEYFTVIEIKNGNYQKEYIIDADQYIGRTIYRSRI